jgi:hypothetical protein
MLNIVAVCLGGILLPFVGGMSWFVVVLLVVCINVCYFVVFPRFRARKIESFRIASAVMNFLFVMFSLAIFIGAAEYIARVLTVYEILGYISVTDTC